MSALWAVLLAVSAAPAASLALAIAALASVIAESIAEFLGASHPANKITKAITGRIIKFDANNFVKSRSFDYKKPIKIIDQNKILLGMGFINEEKTTLHPKLVLNAK